MVFCSSTCAGSFSRLQQHEIPCAGPLRTRLHAQTPFKIDSKREGMKKKKRNKKKQKINSRLLGRLMDFLMHSCTGQRKNLFEFSIFLYLSKTCVTFLSKQHILSSVCLSCDISLQTTHSLFFFFHFFLLGSFNITCFQKNFFRSI